MIATSYDVVAGAEGPGLGDGFTRDDEKRESRGARLRRRALRCGAYFVGAPVVAAGFAAAGLSSLYGGSSDARGAAWARFGFTSASTSPRAQAIPPLSISRNMG